MISLHSGKRINDCTDHTSQMSSLNTDFIVPLDTKLTAESKSLSVSLPRCSSTFSDRISDAPNFPLTGHAESLQTGQCKQTTGM